MSNTASAENTACLLSVIQGILRNEPSGMSSREIALRLVELQAPYSGTSSFIKRVQGLLCAYNSESRESRGSCFLYNVDSGIWTLNMSQPQDFSAFLPEITGVSSPSPQHPRRLQPFHLSRNTTATTMTSSAMTPTPSNSSLSFISSQPGSSLTSGIMEQVSTWRTGEDTDDDDEASLEIYSNPRNRGSFPSQESRGDPYESGESLLNEIEIQPTLHQLQFPQHPLDHHEELNALYQSASRNEVMPPPSSSSSHRRYSGSSQLQRPNFSRSRPGQDDNAGDQFVPNSNPRPPTYQTRAAEILARGSYSTDKRFLGGMVTALDNQDHSFIASSANVSGFPSPLTTAPSPRGQAPTNIFPQQQTSQTGSVRGGEPMDTRRRTPSVSGQSRFSPNHLENGRHRNPSRRSMDGLEAEDNDMRQREPVRPFVRPGFGHTKGLDDLGRTLQKSLSFNGDDEYQATLQDDHTFPNNENARVQGRHHPYHPRARPDGLIQRVHPGRNPVRQVAENNFRDRKGKARAIAAAAELEEEDFTRTPVVLSAINTAQTNILSELMNLQQKSQNDMAHFRQEMYSSLQLAFTKLSEQVQEVGQSVNQAESTQKESVRDLGLNMADAMTGVIDRMSDSLQRQFNDQFERQQHNQQQYLLAQQNHQHQQQQQQSSVRAFSPRTRPVRQSTPFGQSSSASSYPPGIGGGGGGSSSGAGQDPRRHSSTSWREYSEPVYDDDEDDGDDIETEHNRGKRRAIERPRSAGEVMRPVNRPRRDFDQF
ncbi:hypothetical protein EMPS_01802 [Entomortierella parvispora]|uniref:Uncharacterized protein n=1 Tax=Entomortierella parvispora TaxID=205924 RepID=A0A9P3H3I3_9FUNG|nr:hypothetical protein EMPS_01802 [Entomortierella parvispora]